jgi:hypothetical protein
MIKITLKTGKKYLYLIVMVLDIKEQKNNLSNTKIYYFTLEDIILQFKNLMILIKDLVYFLHHKKLFSLEIQQGDWQH